MARFRTANEIINSAAVEVGLLPSEDPIGSTDETFIQMSGLLNSAGQEMVELYPWQGLRKKWSLTTADGDTGIYDLPDDFSYMVDQTGWNKSARLPVGGPISAQAWSYLNGLEFLNNPIYAIFQLQENKFQLYPQPPPPDIEIAFQYQSRNWVTAQGTGITSDVVATGSDLINYEPILIIKFLKVMFLSAKGFATQDAKGEFEVMFNSRTGKDQGAEILSASRAGGTLPLLNNFNVPWTNYGI